MIAGMKALYILIILPKSGTEMFFFYFVGSEFFVEDRVCPICPQSYFPFKNKVSSGEGNFFLCNDYIFYLLLLKDGNIPQVL